MCLDTLCAIELVDKCLGRAERDKGTCAEKNKKRKKADLGLTTE